MRWGEGSETSQSIAGAVLLAGLFSLFAVPFILGTWRRFMARTLLDALVAGRTDLRHISGERQGAVEAALRGGACDLGSLAPAGLVEPFSSAGIDHVLAGEVDGIPFALAELRLHNAEGFEVFAGVVGGFALKRACPGLTLVTRERGVLGNLIASLGSGIERIGLEDPNFERKFEVYGTDQVWSRTVLTTTMLERLVRVDDVAHARGFRCAFVGERMLLAWSGSTGGHPCGGSCSPSNPGSQATAHGSPNSSPCPPQSCANSPWTGRSPASSPARRTSRVPSPGPRSPRAPLR